MRLRITPLLLIAGFLIASCGTGNNSITSTSTPAIRQDLLATFVAKIPSPLKNGNRLALEWVSPLIVHDLNPERISMEPVDDLHFRVDVPVKKGAFLQYRYVQLGDITSIETGTNGNPVISRFYNINNHSVIEDAILGFDSTPESTPTGWIDGEIRIQGSQQSASDILISIAGITGCSSADGSFQIKEIPVGTHNLTIFSPDGLFETIQQQAIIEENNITPIEVELVPKKMVNVTFLVTSPQATPLNAQIRLFGSTLSMGNSFAGLFGGTNPIQDRAPLLTRQSEKESILVLSLPAETEIKYLYSMGDTFWNMELNNNGTDNIRTIYIPRQDVVIKDDIANWNSPTLKPVTFQFTPPEFKETNDVIQIQFNAYGWMDPLQMWPIGDGKYEFILFSPLNFSEDIKYRFCRSSICGIVDPASNSESIRTFKAASEAQVLLTSDTNWSHFTAPLDPTVVSTEFSSQKPGDFLTAIDLSDSFRPNWLSYYPAVLDAIKGLNANSVILPYSWTIQSGNPVWYSPNLARNPTVLDIKNISLAARERGLKVYLRPNIQFTTSPDDFWNQFGETDQGWNELFESISIFYRQSGTLAQQIRADGIILGDEQTSQIITESKDLLTLAGKYPAGSFDKWNTLFSEIKETNQIPVYLAFRFDDLINYGSFDFKNISGIYLLDLGDFSSQAGDTKSYTEITGKKLDESLQPILSGNDLKVWVGLDFPSIDYTTINCVASPSQCNSPGIFNFPAPEQPGVEISLQEQTNLYNAAVPEINRREWINGLSSRRYMVPGGYQDQSSSIRGKPATDIVWYWFSQMNGKPTE